MVSNGVVQPSLFPSYSLLLRDMNEMVEVVGNVTLKFARRMIKYPPLQISKLLFNYSF